MPYEERDNSGTLFKNDRKTTENHPDYKGKCIVNGKPMWMSAWLKKGSSGTFMSFAFQPREDKPKRQDEPFDPPTFDESEVPF